MRSLPGATVEGLERRYDRHGLQVRLADELIRLEFVRYPFPAVGVRDVTVEGLHLDDPADIAANKIVALLDRREGKDLVELWKLTEGRGVPGLQLAVADAERKFGVAGLRHGLQTALLAAANAGAPRLHDPRDLATARAWARDAARALAAESLDEDSA